MPDERIKWQSIRQRYKLSKEQYLTMLKIQNNRCAICGVEFVEGKKVCVDHDHKLSVVRGILCASCNNILSLAEDNPDLLHRAEAYLINSFTRYYERVGWDKWKKDGHQ